MPYSYNIDMEVGCVFVKAWGKISNQEFIDYINQIWTSVMLQTLISVMLMQKSRVMCLAVIMKSVNTARPRFFPLQT